MDLVGDLGFGDFMSVINGIDTKGIAGQKYIKALQHIEMAQTHLGSACQELSALTYACPKWSKVGKMYDRVHDLWRDLAYSSVRQKIDLDSTHKDCLQRGETI